MKNLYVNIEDYFITDIDQVTSQTLENYDLNIYSNKKEALKGFIEKIYDIEKYTEDSAEKEVDMTADEYVGYYSSILMLEKNYNGL